MLTSKRLLQGFVVFGILYSILLLSGNETLTWYLKPFLLPFLFYAVVKSEPFETKKWLLVALLYHLSFENTVKGFEIKII